MAWLLLRPGVIGGVLNLPVIRNEESDLPRAIARTKLLTAQFGHPAAGGICRSTQVGFRHVLAHGLGRLVEAHLHVREASDHGAFKLDLFGEDTSVKSPADQEPQPSLAVRRRGELAEHDAHRAPSAVMVLIEATDRQPPRVSLQTMGQSANEFVGKMAEDLGDDRFSRLGDVCRKCPHLLCNGASPRDFLTRLDADRLPRPFPLNAASRGERVLNCHTWIAPQQPRPAP